MLIHLASLWRRDWEAENGREAVSVFQDWHNGLDQQTAVQEQNILVSFPSPNYWVILGPHLYLMLTFIKTLPVCLLGLDAPNLPSMLPAIHIWLLFCSEMPMPSPPPLQICPTKALKKNRRMPHNCPGAIANTPDQVLPEYRVILFEHHDCVFLIHFPYLPHHPQEHWPIQYNLAKHKISPELLQLAYPPFMVNISPSLLFFFFFTLFPQSWGGGNTPLHHLERWVGVEVNWR